jgi:hypothetical protein
MKRQLLTLALLIVALLFVPSSAIFAQTISLATTFTYQGYLTNAGGPINGLCDLQFSLFDAASAGSQIGAILDKLNVTVTNGVFTTQLGFGGTAFNGTDRYLQLAVRCPAGSGSYTSLTPRQALTPTPYALGLYGLQVQPNATSPNVIGGYSGNGVTAGVTGAFIGGGGYAGSANTVTDNYSVIGGGANNRSGNLNSLLEDAWFSTVGGGWNNSASHRQATVSGGGGNTASGLYATVSGGSSNTASASWSTVGGGSFSRASGAYATVAGGDSNTASFSYSAVGGGRNNTASGDYATVAGGDSNAAQGNFSFAAGRRAKANQSGVFVWGDSTFADVASTAANQFIARASGGVWFYSSSNLSTGATLAAGSGSWASVSDRNVKANFTPVDGRSVLDKVIALPLSTWNYQAQAADIRHIGPMAQDFSAAFGVGEDDTTISSVDADGVALAAIQGLYSVVQDKDKQIAALKTENATQQKQIDDLSARLAALEKLAGTANTPHETGALPGWLLIGGLVIGGWIAIRKQNCL